MPEKVDPSLSEAETHERIKKMRENGAVQERNGDYWSEEDAQQLNSLFYEGVGLSEIAVRTMRTERAVYQKVNSMELFEKVRQPRAPKVNTECLCSSCPQRITCPNSRADSVCSL